MHITVELREERELIRKVILLMVVPYGLLVDSIGHFKKSNFSLEIRFFSKLGSESKLLNAIVLNHGHSLIKERIFKAHICDRGTSMDEPFRTH